MAFSCLAPKLAYQVEKGQKPIFLHVDRFHDYEWYLNNLPSNYKLLLISCGKCANCLKKKSQEWTSRILKETKLYKYSYFITFTYDNNHYKDLNKRDLQLFLKRYRKSFYNGSRFECKYYIMGEYGETTKRSHYHAIFMQNKPIKNLKFYANNLFVSDDFNKIWSLGHCLISKQVNERSIKYTVAYTLKKLGETKIVLMSKGLGLCYLNENKESIKKHGGFYLVDGYKQKPPYYFTRKLKESAEPDDIKYIDDLENKPRASKLLSGNTLGDLVHEFLESSSSQTLKGKGVF